MTAPRILSWRPFCNDARTLRGFFSVELPSGLVLHGCKLMVGPKGQPWIAPPATKREVPDGKPIWDPIVDFRDRETRDRFTAAVLDALAQAHPEATGPP